MRDGAAARAARRAPPALGGLRGSGSTARSRATTSCYALEPLGDHAPAGRVEPLALPHAAAGAPLLDEPHWLVVHAGPEHELDALLAHARGAPRRRHQPAAPHRRLSRRAAPRPRRAHRHRRRLQRDPRDRALRDRHTFVPFPRALDDQFARSGAERAAGLALGHGTRDRGRVIRRRCRDRASPRRARAARPSGRCALRRRSGTASPDGSGETVQGHGHGTSFVGGDGLPGAPSQAWTQLGYKLCTRVAGVSLESSDAASTTARPPGRVDVPARLSARQGAAAGRALPRRDAAQRERARPASWASAAPRYATRSCVWKRKG